MRILALDVSSTATGWAVMEPGPKVLSFGVFKGPAGTAPDRSQWSAVAMRSILCDSDCGSVVMEWLDEHRHVHPHRARSIITCARAQGVVYGLLKQHAAIALVGESDWTRGRSKEARADDRSAEFPMYGIYRDEGYDKGLDCADALGIGLWHLAKLREAELIAASEAAKRGRNAHV